MSNDILGFRVVRELSTPSTTASVTPSAPATSTKLFLHDPAFPAWLAQVQALPAEQQIEAVRKKMMELNPGFDGTLTVRNAKDASKTLTGLEFLCDNVTDISPIRSFRGLKFLECQRIGYGKLSDLAPLQDMSLTSLQFTNTKVSDLTPLKGMPLQKLSLGGTQVTDLSPLKGMPLKSIYLWDCRRLSDLSPLEGCESLESVMVRHTNVTPAAVAALQKALPDCKIEWDDPAKAPTPQPAASGTK